MNNHVYTLAAISVALALLTLRCLFLIVRESMENAPEGLHLYRSDLGSYVLSMAVLSILMSAGSVLCALSAWWFYTH